MARYRKIDPRIWNDEKFASLSHEAQRMFFFVLTHPSMTALGAFRISKSGMAAELGLDEKGFVKPFAELLAKGLVRYDERAFLLFAPNFPKYNPPENPNVVKGWAGAINLLPECPLLVAVLERAKASASNTDAGSKAFDNTLGRVYETLLKRYAKPLPKGMPKQEQEQEQEQEILVTADAVTRGLSAESSTTDLALDSSPEEKTPKHAPAIPYERIIALYNQKLGAVLGICRQLSSQRKAVLRSRWRDIAKAMGVTEYDTADVLDGFDGFYDKVTRSDFLMGRSKNWRASFDWIHKESNWLKIFEGNYQNDRYK